MDNVSVRIFRALHSGTWWAFNICSLQVWAHGPSPLLCLCFLWFRHPTIHFINHSICWCLPDSTSLQVMVWRLPQVSEPLKRPVRSNLLNPKKWSAYPSMDSWAFHRLHDLWNHDRLNEKQLWRSRGLLLILTDMKEVCKATLLTKFILFWKIYSYFS